MPLLIASADAGSLGIHQQSLQRTAHTTMAQPITALPAMVLAGPQGKAAAPEPAAAAGRRLQLLQLWRTQTRSERGCWWTAWATGAALCARCAAAGSQMESAWLSGGVPMACRRKRTGACDSSVHGQVHLRCNGGRARSCTLTCGVVLSLLPASLLVTEDACTGLETFCGQSQMQQTRCSSSGKRSLPREARPAPSTASAIATSIAGARPCRCGFPFNCSFASINRQGLHPSPVHLSQPTTRPSSCMVTTDCSKCIGMQGSEHVTV